MKQQTYMMVKPEILADERQAVGEILAAVCRAGFRVLAMQTRRLERPLVERFYAEHRGKEFFPALVEYIASGPVLALRLEGPDAVRRLRELVGATDPAKAACGTLRSLYGRSLTRNAVHASATPEDAERELGIIFGDAAG